MLLAYVAVIRWDKLLHRYRIFSNWWRADWQVFGTLVRIGTPISLTVVAEAGIFGAAAFMMGRFGAAELAGHTVALQLAALAFQVPFGIGQAATIRVGYFFGARGNATFKGALLKVAKFPVIHAIWLGLLFLLCLRCLLCLLGWRCLLCLPWLVLSCLLT